MFKKVLSITFLVVLSFNEISFGEVQTRRPFWTEKSSYIEGSVLYSVGISTNAKSLEQGRQTTHENGIKEIGNFAQITDLSGINIETQMTYEERNQDGSFNVFRLLKTEMADLTKWKTTLLSRANAELEKQNKQVAIQIESKRHQIETLERQSAELASLDLRASQIQQRVMKFNANVDQHIRCGMTMDEVESLLGKPRAIERFTSEKFFWNYGEKWLTFDSRILVSIGSNTKHILGEFGCK